MIVPVLSVFLLALGVLLLGVLAISIERAKARQSQSFMEDMLKQMVDPPFMEGRANEERVREDEEFSAPLASAAIAEQTVVVVPCAETVQSCIVPLRSAEAVTGHKR